MSLKYQKIFSEFETKVNKCDSEMRGLTRWCELLSITANAVLTSSLMLIPNLFSSQAIGQALRHYYRLVSQHCLL